MVQTIVDAESSFPAKHLIAQNIANGSTKIDKPNPHVSIFNYHYSTPPDSVAMNYDHKKAICDDETGFRGQKNEPHRMEGWDFILAGGAVYDTLDYSCTWRHADCTETLTSSPVGAVSALSHRLYIL